MDKPLVAIMIPTYNDSGTLKRCLRSALEQDYENLMVVALDNRSEDGTYDILVDFERQYRDRLYTGRTFARLISHEHRRRCLDLINPRSRFVQYLNAAGVLLPTYVSHCVELFESNEQIGCVMTHADVLHPSGSIEPAPGYYPGDCVIAGDTQMESFMARGLEVNAVQLYRIEVYNLSLAEKLVFKRFPDWLPLVMASSISNLGYIHETLAFRGDSAAIQGERFIANVEDLLEHYIFLQAFNTIAARLERHEVCEQFPSALKRLGMECVRSSRLSLEAGEPLKARSCLSLALAYLPEIAETSAFRQVAELFENRSQDWK